MQGSYLVVTDRGGHLHDALRLVSQIGSNPKALVTTFGPDVDYLKKNEALKDCEILTLPMAFSWWGKFRFFNPFLFLIQITKALFHFLSVRPDYVISTGATAVVPFCYIARVLGAKIIHVENLAQVVNPSVAGRFLYPIASHFFVQWPDLLKAYGSKAEYAGNIV